MIGPKTFRKYHYYTDIVEVKSLVQFFFGQTPQLNPNAAHIWGQRISRRLDAGGEWAMWCAATHTSIDIVFIEREDKLKARRKCGKVPRAVWPVTYPNDGPIGLKRTHTHTHTHIELRFLVNWCVHALAYR